MTIESTIQRLTKDGEIVVQFLVDTVQGNIYNATVGHRLKSAEWLAALGGTIPEDALPKSASIRPKPKSKPKQAKTDKRDKADKKPLVTEKQILHFDIARAIMRQTRDGESIIEFLIRVVAKIERDGENFTPAARMRAARELLLRGFGNCIPGINRILSGKTEALDSHISKTIREYADYGMEPIRFLIDAMENEIPEIEPKSKAAFNFNKRLSQSVNNKRRPKGFTASQRVWAACELLRRAYDIRTDHITPADIQAYWQSQTPTQKIDDFSTPDIDLMGVTPQQVEAEITQMRASDAAKAAADNAATAEKSDDNAATTRAERRRQQRAARKTAAKATAANQTDGNGNGNTNNSAAAEKPAAKAASAHRSEQPVDNTPVDNSNNAQDNQVSAEKPAAKTVTGNAAATTTRAERRRQQRAAQKAQKPAATTAEKPAVAKTPATTQKPIDKMLADNTPMSATTASAIAQKPVITEVIALNAPTAADAPPNLTRAERRRQQRAAKKRSNPVDTANNAADSINPTEIDAPNNNNNAADAINHAPNPTEVDTPPNDNNPDAPADVDTKPANPSQSNPRPRLTRAERRRLKRKNRKRPPNNRSP